MSEKEKLEELVLRGDAATALKFLRAALQRAPEDPELHGLMGQVYLKLRRLTEAEDALRTALRLDPDQTAARWNLAILARHQGRLDEAVERFRAELARTPDSSFLHCCMARTYAVRRELAPAREHLARALALAPDSPRVHQELASFLYDQRDLAEAERHLLRARELDPEDAYTPGLLSFVYLTAKRHDEAREAAREALRMQPDEANAQRTLLALVELRAGDGPEVDPAASPALVAQMADLLARAAEPALANPAIGRLALHLASRGRAGAAATALAAFLELNPQVGVAHLLLAQLHALSGSNPAARRAMERAALVMPAGPELHYRWAELLEQEGELAAAEEKLRIALGVEPDSARCLGLLAVVRTRRGDPLEGKTLAEQALARDPAERNARTVLWCLEVPGVMRSLSEDAK